MRIIEIRFLLTFFSSYAPKNKHFSRKIEKNVENIWKLSKYFLHLHSEICLYLFRRGGIY